MYTDVGTLFLVGVIATAYMSLIHWIADSRWIGTRNFIRAIGSFLMPEPLRSRGGSLVLHFLAGVGFTMVYAYVFSFLEPVGIPAYVRLGVLMGLVHGFFLGIFFNAFDPVEGLHAFKMSTALLNVVSHVVFGAVVGLGLGVTAKTGTPMWFAVYAIGGLVLAGFVIQQTGLASLPGHRHGRMRTSMHRVP